MTTGKNGLKVENTDPQAVSVLFHAENEYVDIEAFNDELSALMYKYKIVQVQAAINLYPMIKSLQEQVGEKR